MGKLALAGMISGAGAGVQQGLANMQSGIIQTELLKERDAMETRRLQLMEQYATGRETRGYAHAETMQQKTQDFTASESQKTRDFTKEEAERGREFTGSESEKQRGFTKEENQATRDQAMAIAKATDQRLIKEGKLSREQADKHFEATHKLAEAQLRATQEKVSLIPMGDGTFQRVNAQGKVLGLAMDPTTKKPIVGGHDLPAATKLQGEVILTMIRGNEARLRQVGILPDEIDRINAENERLRGDLDRLLGKGSAAAPASNIVDPFAPKPPAPAGGSMLNPGVAPSSPPPVHPGLRG